MNIVVLKVITTAATFVIAVLGIWASYKLRKFTKWFDIASAFSAGIILATAYTHMLPEAIHMYDHYLYDQQEASSSPGVVNGGSAPQAVEAGGTTAIPVIEATAPPAPKKKKCCNHHHHGDDHAHFHRRLSDDATIEEEEKEPYPLIPFLAALSFLCLFLVERGAIIYMKNKKNHSRKEETEAVNKYGDESGVTCDSPHGHDDHGHSHNHASTAIDCCKDIQSLEKMSEVTAFALILAVSLHAIMEGMGMGSRNTTKQVLTAFIGVAAHKGLEGFAVGANLVESAVSTRRFIMYAGVVCLASPLGALIGYLMTLGNAQVGIVNPILGALAVGTFLQVATMEFLPRAFARPEHFWLKALGLLTGFAIMSVMPLFVPHEH
jgi:zinc transporter ZupT